MSFQMRFHVAFLTKSLIASRERAFMGLFSSMRHNVGFKRVPAAEGRITNFAFERPNIKMPF